MTGAAAGDRVLGFGVGVGETGLGVLGLGVGVGETGFCVGAVVVGLDTGAVVGVAVGPDVTGADVGAELDGALDVGAPVVLQTGISLSLCGYTCTRGSIAEAVGLP